MKDLRFFLNAAKALSLYRKLWRCTLLLAEPEARAGLRAQIRAEFERGRSADRPDAQAAKLREGAEALRTLTDCLRRTL